MYNTEIKCITLLLVLVGVGTESTNAYILQVVYPMRIVGHRQVTVRFMN